MSGKRDSNPRPQPWQGCALPTELFPHYFLSQEHFSECGCKGTAFFWNHQTFLVVFFQKKTLFQFTFFTKEAFLLHFKAKKERFFLLF